MKNRRWAVSAILGLFSLACSGLQAPQAASLASPVAPPAEPAAPVEHVLQDGTAVKLSLINELSSGNAELGQEIRFEVVNDLALDGVTVLHRGAAVTGAVVEAVAKKKMGRAGKLNFTIQSLKLADGESVPLRAFNNTNGESHSAGVAVLALHMPVVAAPFFLLMHGENSTIPKGTELTVFISGDNRLDLSKFGPPAPAIR